MALTFGDIQVLGCGWAGIGTDRRHSPAASGPTALTTAGWRDGVTVGKPCGVARWWILLIQRGDFLGSGDARCCSRIARRCASLIENRALAAGHVSLLRQLGQPGAVLREVDRLGGVFGLAGIPATHGGLNAGCCWPRGLNARILPCCAASRSIRAESARRGSGLRALQAAGHTIQSLERRSLDVGFLALGNRRRRSFGRSASRIASGSRVWPSARRCDSSFRSSRALSILSEDCQPYRRIGLTMLPNQLIPSQHIIR